MTLFQARDAQPIRLVADAYGHEVALIDDGREITCSLLREFRLGDRDYAVLLPEGDDAGEYVLLRIVQDGKGGIALESIDDDEEWEIAAEVYDEMTFEP